MLTGAKFRCPEVCPHCEYSVHQHMSMTKMLSEFNSSRKARSLRLLSGYRTTHSSYGAIVYLIDCCGNCFICLYNDNIRAYRRANSELLVLFTRYCMAGSTSVIVGFSFNKKARAVFDSAAQLWQTYMTSQFL